MRKAVPNYFHKFKCIADKCKHNCCIGWEIDIDEETLSLYNALDTLMGEKIRENITGDVPHFKLKEDDRCPFLNSSGLCDIISEYGEDAICDICYLHPRFKNFYSSFTETGLGLACEEAARVILTEENKFEITPADDGMLTKKEKEFFAKREEIFSILTNRKKSIYERFGKLAEKFGIELEFSAQELYRMYQSLERLDDSWTKELEGLKEVSISEEIFKEDAFQIPFEQLSVYFIFRHLTGVLEDGDYKKRVKFALLSCYLLGALFQYNKPISQEKLIDIVRMYSQEVEYSEENTEALMNYSKEILVEKMESQSFDELYGIMEESFPVDEIRPYEEQKELLDNPLYAVYVIKENDKVKAFIATWEFEKFVFVEHFAVGKRWRNTGLGSKLLEKFVSMQEKMVCLEVELPQNELAKRRIGFYQRNGFFLNEYDYFQPPISEGRSIVPLMIMTLGEAVNKEVFNNIRDILYEKVYKYKEM